MKNILLLNLILLSFLGCNRYKSTDTKKILTFEIDENNVREELNIKDIFVSLRLTPLKYSKGIIGQIESIIFSNDKYFVHDSSIDQILIFDSNGNYLNKIYAQGPGPKEYGAIHFFDLDKLSQQIVIFDFSMGGLSYFDFNGNFLHKKRLPLICRDFAVTKSGNIICYSPDELVEKNNSVYQPGVFLLSKNGEIIDHKEMGNTGFIPMLTGKSLIEYNKMNYLFSNYNDVIYEITDTKINPFAQLNFKNKINNEVFYNSNFKTENMLAPFLKINPYKRKKHIGFTFLQKGEIRFMDVNLETKDYRIGKKLKKDEQFKFFNLNGFQVSDNEFVTILNDEVLLQYKQYLKTSTATDFEQEFQDLQNMLALNGNNPILVSAYFN